MAHSRRFLWSLLVVANATFAAARLHKGKPKLSIGTATQRGGGGIEPISITDPFLAVPIAQPTDAPGKTLAANATQTNPHDSQFLNVVPVKADKLLWIFGCSLDTQAFVRTCQSAGATMFTPTVPGSSTSWKVAVPPVGHTYPHMFNMATKVCTVNGVTMFFTFHPGATPPPYWTLAQYLETKKPTLEIAQLAVSQMSQTFGSMPDAMVVDSSLWDAAGWWTKDGEPQNWPFPSSRIQELSDTTIPNLLSALSGIAQLADSHIAFRSPPPLTSFCWADAFAFACEGDKIVETMYSRLLTHVNTATLQLFGKYHFLDYHKIVLSQTNVLGGTVRSHYTDDIHPGEALSNAYMSAVLAWVKGLQ